ncbi:amidase domain-containing protein [Mycobacteroides abscessus]|uniref:amidase domain-containing protein n=1 Tax=Mycobacteroides abscessus TaxID=36809 RepID=UPI001F25EDAA|nr:amidase domain-containing protein [Mycobacteroides abscessus]
MTTSELHAMPPAATSRMDNQDRARRLAAASGGAVLLVASVVGLHHLYRTGDEFGELMTWSVLLLGLFTALGGGIKLIMWGLRPVISAVSDAAKEQLPEPVQAVIASGVVIAGVLGMWWSFRGGYSAWWQQITGEAGWSLILGVGQMLVVVLAGAALFTGGKYLFGLAREVVTGVDDAGAQRNRPQKSQDESLWHPGLVAALVGGGLGLVLLTAGITPRLYVWITGPQILPAVGAIAVVLLVAIGSNLGWWKGLTGLYKWATAASQKATAAAGVIAVLMFSAGGLGLGWFTPATVPVARAACPPDCGGPGGSDGPPGGGQMFQPPSQGGPQMPDYQGGINQPPMDQNGSVSIYNTQAPSVSNNGVNGSSGQQGPQQGWDQPAHGTQPPDYQNATPYTQGPGRPNPDFNGGQTNPGNSAGSQGGQANQGAQQPPSQNNAGQQPPQNQPPQQNTEQPNQSDQQRLDELTRQLQEKQQQSAQDRQRIDDLTKQLQQGQQKQEGNQKLPRFPSKDDKKDRDQQDRDDQSQNTDLAALLMGAASTRRRKQDNQQQPAQQQQGPDTQALTQDGAQLGQSLPGDIANTVSDSASLGQSAGSAAQNFGQAGQAGASLASSAQSGAVNPQDAITLVQGVSGGIKDTADAVKSGSQITSTWLENSSQGTKIASDVSPQTKQQMEQLQQFLDDGKQGADTVNKLADMTSQGAGAVNSVASMDPSQVKSVELMSGDATAMGGGFQQAPQFEAPMEPAPTPPPAPAPPAGRYADVPVGGNRADAVKFAERYAKGWGADEMYFNPQDYDCTNFVSYALREGGFKPADPFHINNHTEDQWFNTSLKLGSPSAAWDNAKGLLTYINNGYGKTSGGPVGSVIGETTFNPSTAPWDPDQLSKMGMKPGDLIFYDFHTGEGVIHASMYVGKQQFVDMPGMGDAVDYHTNDVQHHSWALPHLDDSGNPTDVTYRFVRMLYLGE